MIAKEYRLCEKQVKKALQSRKPFFGGSGMLFVSPAPRGMSGGLGIVLSGKSTRGSVNRNFFRRRFYDYVRTHFSQVQTHPQYLVFCIKKGTLLNHKDPMSISEFDSWVDASFRRYIQLGNHKTSSPSTTERTK